ncbi:MAG: hypothetical protein K5931_00075 [Lachnospiraceae bacterium]|nr:hypothetical protein [Lachnospiraceae bacterium]
MKEYSRRGYNINKKFFQFLLPSLLSGLAMSLNEFVDSIIVSQLLGASAMSMVGMASPIMFLFAIVSIMLGVGGSTVYAEYAGKQEKKKSEEVFSTVMIVSLIVSVIIAVTGIVFIDQLTEKMCVNQDLIPVFKPYTMVLILSGVLIIPVQTLVSFFPAFGRPQTATIVNILANGVNLLMDMVYISFFGSGLKGAAIATLTGYLTGVIFIVVIILTKKVSLPFTKPGRESLSLLGESVTRGAPGAIGQLGFLIKVSFCNHISTKLGGMVGIATFSLCIQAFSIVSIGMSGVISAMVPIGSVLMGQRDFKGIKILLKSVFIVQFAASLIFTVLFEAFPQLLCYIYNYSGEYAKEAITGIRIFSPMFVFRGFILIIMYYFQIVGRKLYASVISAVDGFAGLIPIILILTPFFGIKGLWLAFPVLSILMIVFIMIINLCIARNSMGKYEGVMLLDTEERNVSVYDATFLRGKDTISDFVLSLQDFCKTNISSKKTEMLVALATEEMLSYVSDHGVNKNAVEQIDLLVKILKDAVIIDIRCIGEPIDPTSAPSEQYTNVDVLKRIATKLDYTYVLGMNQTRITI